MMRPSTARLTRILFYPMYAVLIYMLQKAMAGLPNIELTSMLVMLSALLLRWRALIPIYIYVFLMGLTDGFPTWWIPYLYLWLVAWGMAMLLPKKMPDAVAAVVYPVTCGLFGLMYGTLYAPSQALLFGLNLKGMFSWIVAGLGFDALHAAGNTVAGLLILPLYATLKNVIVLPEKTK